MLPLESSARGLSAREPEMGRSVGSHQALMIDNDAVCKLRSHTQRACSITSRVMKEETDLRQM